MQIEIRTWETLWRILILLFWRVRKEWEHGCNHIVSNWRTLPSAQTIRTFLPR